MLTTGLRAKLTEVVRHFDRDEIGRLRRIAPSLLVRMDSSDEPVLADEIVQLVCMAPDEAAAWIRGHLDEIETRFAS